MSSFKDHILELLSATDYSFQSNLDNVNFVESPFTTWFTQNITQENCLTQEELDEFQALEESGQVLYGEELDNALQEYFDAGAVVPVVRRFDDIKQEELEHHERQLDVQKQLVSVLSSSLYSLDDVYRDQQKKLKSAEDQRLDVLTKFFAANSEYKSKLHLVKDAFKTLLSHIMELTPNQELSADVVSGTYLSDKCNSSRMSCSSTMSTMSTLSSYKVESKCKLMCQMPLTKYTKKHDKFCKYLKDLLLNCLCKMHQKEGTEDASLMVQNMYVSLFTQKLKEIELTAELAGIDAARNKIKETVEELKRQLWKPTQPVLRARMLELDDSRILNESDASSIEDQEDVCKQWADHQVLSLLSAGLTEKTEYDKWLLQKLDELISILNARLSVDELLCEKMHLDNDCLTNFIELYSEVCNVLVHRVESSKARMDVMKENQDDYNEMFANYRSDLVDCLAAALNCDKANIPETYSHLLKQSRDHHQEFVKSCNEKLQTLSSVHKDLKEFHREEEERKLSAPQTVSNQDHFDSITQTLESLASNIEDINMLCHTLLENKEFETK